MLQPEDRKLQMIFENTVRLIETQEHDRDVIAYYQLRAKEANVPLTSAQVQERQNEERRKLDEESVIATGKWIPILPKTTASVQRKSNNWIILELLLLWNLILKETFIVKEKTANYTADGGASCYPNKAVTLG